MKGIFDIFKTNLFFVYVIMYRKIGFFRLQKLLVSGRIYVTEDKIWCGSREGSGVQLYPASSDNSIPSGIIAMWSGASNAIPSGWFLCDGNNNTPDLRNRFIVGAGSSYEVGATGGSDTVTLSTNQMPSHNHSHSLSTASAGSHTHSDTFSVSLSGLRCSSAGSHSHTLSNVAIPSRLPYSSSSSSMDGGARSGGSRTTDSSGSHTHTISGSGSLSGSISSGGAHTHSISGSISNTGGGQAHENRPPYYALCFIMKA